MGQRISRFTSSSSRRCDSIFYDLFVDVPDYPGVISEVTRYLGEEEISLTNIKILETREDIFGVLQITFQSDEDRDRAKRCIETRSNYTCHYE